MRDDEFLRNKVPMTKSEVRAISIDKLELSDKNTFLDIGAGTGIKWQQIESYLLRETMPLTKTLQKIADALEMEVADLFLPPEGSE